MFAGLTAAAAAAAAHRTAAETKQCQESQQAVDADLESSSVPLHAWPQVRPDGPRPL